MTCKGKCKSLFNGKIANFGEQRKFTLYLRTSYTNDNCITLPELSYPLEILGLIKQNFYISSELAHETDEVVQAGIATHLVWIPKSVDLSMLDYDNVETNIGQKRNILIFTDFSSPMYPNGNDQVFKILTPDAVEDFARPFYKKLFVKWQGSLSREGSLRN